MITFIDVHVFLQVTISDHLHEVVFHEKLETVKKYWKDGTCMVTNPLEFCPSFIGKINCLCGCFVIMMLTPCYNVAINITWYVPNTFYSFSYLFVHVIIYSQVNNILLVPMAFNLKTEHFGPIKYVQMCLCRLQYCLKPPIRSSYPVKLSGMYNQ